LEPSLRDDARRRLALVAGVTTLWEHFEADMKLALALSALCATVVALLWFATAEHSGLDGVARPSSAVEAAPALLDEPAEATLTSERSAPTRLSPETARVELVRLQVHVVTRGSRARVSNHRVAAFRTGAPLEWSERPLSTGEALPGELASTDSNGDATLFVEPDHPHVIASVDDWAPRSRVEIAALAAGDSRTLEIVVREPPDRVVHGLVLEAGTGAPVPDARVGFTEKGPEIVRTDERGAFVVSARSREHKQFVVTRADWLATYAPLEAGHELADLRMVVLMARRTHVDVRVVDRSGAEVDAKVRANFDRERLTLGAPFLSDDVWYGVARPGAPVRLGNIPAQIELTLSAEGLLGAHVSQPVILPASSRATALTVVLEAGDTILGTVSGFRRRNGLQVRLLRPRPFARAGARSSRQTEALDVAVDTDDNGNFRFSGLGAGTVRLSCTDTATALVTPVLELEIVGDGRTHEVALVATPAAHIRGVLWSEDGSPRAGRVSARRTDEVEAVHTHADKQGKFTFDPLAPGYYEVTSIGGARSASATLNAVAGDNFVELRVRPHWRLSLQLVDTTGAAVRGSVTVASETRFGAPGSLIRFRSDDEGLVTLLCAVNGKPARVSARSADGTLVGEREFAPRDPNDEFGFPERFVLAPAPLRDSNEPVERSK